MREVTSVVYFLKPVGMPGPIKIGRTVDIRKRLATFASWSPIRLEVAASVVGSAALERRLHETFAFAHSHLEWFYPVDELLQGISALQQGADVEQAFDLSKKTGSIRKGQPYLQARFTPQYRERWSYHHSFRTWHQKLWGSGLKYETASLVSDLMDGKVSQTWLTDEERSTLQVELEKLKIFVKANVKSNAQLRPDIFGAA